MRVQVVEHHADGGRLREVVIHEQAHLEGEVHAGTSPGDVDLPPTQAGMRACHLARHSLTFEDQRL